MRRPSDFSYPRLLLIGLGLVIGIVLLIAASISGAAFGSYNPTWEGTSDLRSIAQDEGAETTVIREPAEYDDLAGDGTIVIITSPEEPYSAAEIERINAFVERGGTVLVADAFGPHSNALLDELGATTRIDGDPLRDERHYHQSPLLPEAIEVADHPYTGGSDSVTLNYGTALDPGEATVLVRTSEYAYLDRNRNNELDDDEELASYPVVTVENVGDGQIVTASDPSIFINVMLEQEGNRALAAGLFDSHEEVALDNSKANEDVPPAMLAVLLLRESALLQLLLGGGLVVGLATLVRRPDLLDRIRARFDDEPRTDEARLDADEMRAFLSQQHPDWDEQRRERTITMITRRRERERDD
jgi:hypothetical protein